MRHAARGRGCVVLACSLALVVVGMLVAGIVVLVHLDDVGRILSGGR